MVQEIWIDGGKYQNGDTVSFLYLYGPEYNPISISINGKLINEISTLNGDCFIRIENKKCPDFSRIYSKNLIVRNSFHKEI